MGYKDLAAFIFSIIMQNVDQYEHFTTSLPVSKLVYKNLANNF